MPYVNVKVVKQQVSQEQKSSLINGVMDIIVNIIQGGQAHLNKCQK
jgi:4-oxalocrotonate tautomerase family enzyme